MTYIVMECHPAFAVLMDEKGRFVKAANRRYEVGQTVTDPVLETAPRRRMVPSLKTVGRAVLAMAACLLIVLGVARFAASPSPYASVVMTINPSVRIDMDKNGAVTRTVGLNEDGKTLLEGYSFDKTGLAAVTEDLLERATAMGYLKENGTVSFEVTCSDASKKSHMEQTLVSCAQAMTAESKVTVEIKGAPATSQATAQTAEVSTTAARTTTTAASQQTNDSLSEDEALTIVLWNIGATRSDVQDMSVERDFENGKTVYEIELSVNGVEYDYCVDAVSGEILTLESEREADDDDRGRDDRD